MEQQQGENNQGNPPNSNGSGNTPIGNNSGGGQGANSNTNSAHTIHHEPINVIIQNQQPPDINAASANRISALSNRIAKRANRISIANLIIEK
jgi:hypothetical protein